MLTEFLVTHRTELTDRCRAKVASRSGPRPARGDAEHGVPIFMKQLIKTLESDRVARPANSEDASQQQQQNETNTAICESAMQHGGELLAQGFSIDQVVHGYGDLCQAVTELAFEVHAPITVNEFRTLNRCLDDAIAGAVTQYSSQQESLLMVKGTEAANERLGILAHELRNLVHTAMLAVTAIKAGHVGLTGATGTVLDRSLIGLRTLIDRSLADVRASAGMTAQLQRLSVVDFIAEIGIYASLEARSLGCKFEIAHVEPGLAVDADRDLLFSALGNLLQNAFKFTHLRTDVLLRAYAEGDRVLIDVEDHCGGLPPGAAETMFQPFTQNSADKSGLGLGLAICRRSVEANNGILRVRDVPGAGCVFTIDLPRQSLP